MTTKIPFFEYPRLWSNDRKEFLSIIDSVSASGGFILQKAVSDFELELANYADSNYAVGVGSATDGMEIFLEAIGVKPGDEIIISSHTMLATASAIKVAGGIPVPVDIGIDNLISIQGIEESAPLGRVLLPEYLHHHNIRCSTQPCAWSSRSHLGERDAWRGIIPPEGRLPGIDRRHRHQFKVRWVARVLQ